MSESIVIHRKKSRMAAFLRPFLRESALAVGLCIVFAFVAVSLAAPWIATHAPEDQDLMSALQPPSALYWFGTDELGRDLFSRIVYAARVDLTIAIGGVLLAYVIALPFGLSAGYFGGRADRWISAVSESILAFPSLVLAIVLVSIIGSGVSGLVVTITVTQAPQLIRYIRGFVLQLREMEYIQAAKAAGSGILYILFRHILRNTLGPTVVILSLLASEAVLVAAALGFLGLGVQPPDPEWGTMLSRSRSYFAQTPHLMLFPGLAIALLILGFNLVGDGLRDRLDAKKR